MSATSISVRLEFLFAVGALCGAVRESAPRIPEGSAKRLIGLAQLIEKLSADETGPVPDVSAERAAELAPDTRPSVAPGDPVAAARADGYAQGYEAAVADVRADCAGYAKNDPQWSKDTVHELCTTRTWVGAAARAKEKP